MLKHHVSMIVALAALAAAAPSTPAQDLGDVGGRRVERDVPFVATPSRVVDTMLTMAGVTKDDVLYDLGSGDGRIVVAAASKYGARATGVDIDPRRIAEGRDNARKAGVGGRVRFIEGNLFDADLRDATVVTLYLLPAVNLKLRPKLLRDLRPGTRIVSHEFDMGEWRPDRVQHASDATVYLWIVPAQVEGRWEAQGAGLPRGLRLKQSFQDVSGTVEIDGREVPLEDATLVGARLTFVARPAGGAPLRFQGTVAGETLQGTIESSGQARSFVARRTSG